MPDRSLDETGERIFQILVTGDVGVDRADAHGRLDVERYFVVIVGNPDGEDRAVGERIPLGGAHLAVELQGVELAYVAYLLHLAAQKPIADVAHRILQHHAHQAGFALLEIAALGRTHVEKERNGIHALGCDGHLFFGIGVLTAAPAGFHHAALPIVVVIALKRIVALVEVALEILGAQGGRIDPYLVGVLQIVEPPVGGQRAAHGLDQVIFAAVALGFGRLHLHGARLGVGKHLGAVADAVLEHLARMVELRRERQGGCEGQYD